MNNPRQARTVTIEHRLLVSNVLMIVVPVAIAALVALGCLGVIYNTMHAGSGVGLGDEGDFYWTGQAATELVERSLDDGVDDASLDALASALGKAGLSLAVWRDGALVYRSSGVDSAELSLASAAQSVGSLPAVVRTSGEAAYVGTTDDGTSGYQVAVFGSIGEVTGGALKSAAIVSGAVILAAVVAAVILTNRFCKRYVYDHIIGPLAQLGAGVQRISAGDLSYRVGYQGDDEFMPIARSFDQMAQGLQDAADREERERRNRQELIVCISHDLRSPLTSMRGYAEGLRDGIASTPERRERYASRIVAKTEEMGRLVSQLFLFSKLDLDELPHDDRPVDLDAFAQDVVGERQDDLARQGITLALGTLEPATALCDPTLLERAVTNVLDNAVRYAPGCTLTVSVVSDDEVPTLCLADDGPGVPDETLPHLFELFYRTDPARGTKGGSSGLGLAIVQRAVVVMGGSAVARKTEGGGLTILLRLRGKEQERNAEGGGSNEQDSAR